MPLAEDRLALLQVLKLLQLVRLEDNNQIEKLTTNGIPNLINYSEPNDGETALHLAACSNNEKVITLLLELGASPDVVDHKGRTPSIRAAEYGHIQALTLFTEADADLTVKDKDGKNILYYCIHPTKRHKECMELSINCGAYVHNVGTDCKSLLVVTAEEKLPDLLKVLLKYGANPDSYIEETGQSALHVASTLGCSECVRALLEFGANVNQLDNENKHVAHGAALNGHFNILKILSAYGADLGQANTDGNTPMHLAASRGFGAICKYLGQRGCLATIKNKEGQIPRLIAKDCDFREAMKECRKAEKLKVGKAGTEPWAVRLYDWMLENNKKILEIMETLDPDESGPKKGKIQKQDFIAALQSLKAPIEDNLLIRVANQHDPNKDDIVDYNIFLTGKKYINKFYVVGGAKKKKKGSGKSTGRRNRGKTKIVMPICTTPDGPRSKKGGPPADYIERYVHFTDNRRFDRDHPPDHPIQDDSAWYLTFPDKKYVNIAEAVKLKDIETLRTAFQRGTHVDQKDKYFKTPLMIACLEGHLELVKLLIDEGADTNAQDNFKWTPLHFACHSGHLDIVQLLLEMGAELDAQAANGGTPITRAIECSREIVVHHLIEKGAKIQLENKKGETALDIAKAYADPRVLAIVQKRWDEIPPHIDKKRVRSPRKNAPKSASGERKQLKEKQQDQTKQMPPIIDDSPKRKSSILRAASAIGIAYEQEDSITFTPRRVWVPQPKTIDLIKEKEISRQRFGYEVDFPDYKPQFQTHINQRCAELEALDD